MSIKNYTITGCRGTNTHINQKCPLLVESFISFTLTWFGYDYRIVWVEFCIYSMSIDTFNCLVKFLCFHTYIRRVGPERNKLFLSFRNLVPFGTNKTGFRYIYVIWVSMRMMLLKRGLNFLNNHKRTNKLCISFCYVVDCFCFIYLLLLTMYFYQVPYCVILPIVFLKHEYIL